MEQHSSKTDLSSSSRRFSFQVEDPIHSKRPWPVKSKVAAGAATLGAVCGTALLVYRYCFTPQNSNALQLSLGFGIALLVLGLVSAIYVVHSMRKDVGGESTKPYSAIDG